MLASQQDAPTTMLETPAPIKEVSSMTFPGRAREGGCYEAAGIQAVPPADEESLNVS